MFFFSSSLELNRTILNRFGDKTKKWEKKGKRKERKYRSAKLADEQVETERDQMVISHFFFNDVLSSCFSTNMRVLLTLMSKEK